MEAIKEIIKIEKPDILLIQETKISDVEIMVLSRSWKNCHGKAISSRGTSRGITTLFSNKFSIKSMRESHHWLLIEIQEKDNSNPIYICNVYGPMHYKDKAFFWEELLKLHEDLQGKNLIIVGDFNTTKL